MVNTQINVKDYKQPLKAMELIILFKLLYIMENVISIPVRRHILLYKFYIIYSTLHLIKATS